MSRRDDIWLAGVDGCRGGWIVAFVRPHGDDARLRIVPRFADVLAAPERPAVVAVDMPIGLPERTGLGGRAAENCRAAAARRAAIVGVLGAVARRDLCRRTIARPARIALATSDPPRKVSKQLFMIAPKIREVDEALRADAGRARRACSRCIPRSRSGGSTASVR